MKKLIVLMLAVVMLAGVGCSKLGQFSEPAKEVIDYICAGDEGKITAANMLAALELGAGLWKGDPVDIQKAFAVLDFAKKTGCFVIAELENAFKVVDAVNTATQAKQLKMLRAAPTPRPEYKTLRKYIK